LTLVNRDQLFLNLMADLQSRVATPDEYGMLKTAALLRQLLLDSPRLVDEVNRERRLKITFRVMEKDAYVQMLLDSGATFYSVEDGLDPNTAPFGNPRDVNRDQFLKLRVMVLNNHAVSVMTSSTSLPTSEVGFILALLELTRKGRSLRLQPSSASVGSQLGSA